MPATQTAPTVEAPTASQYTNLQAAYDYFNEKLFNSELKPCMITLHSRGKKTFGLFHAEQWGKDNSDEVIHEIALSPLHLNRPLVAVFGTLVHEMVHLWQQDYGTPSRNGYHNREWGTMMESVGLQPSDTGEIGGKKTGVQMTHYVLTRGAFELAFNQIPASISLPWLGAGRHREVATKAKNKVKYGCTSCDVQAWGKPGLALKCVECDTVLLAEQPG
jgi:predicted SprT family Zn-dependent metalloprotease